MDKRKNVAVIIPAYNEGKGISSLIKSILIKEVTVVVVDDGSTDETYETAKNSGAYALRNEVNGGKGASIIKGIRWCLEKGHAPVILMDADGQHVPDKIDDFIKEYEEKNLDLIIGTRMKKTDAMPIVRLITNRFMSWFTSMFIGVPLSDTQCGFRLYSKKTMQMHNQIEFKCLRFDYDSEVLFYASKMDLSIGEIDVPTVYLKDRKSRINPLIDTIRWIKALIFMKRRILHLKKLK